ncbi:MAG: hypothetical protein JW882_09500 [Deltaproteobacteria bacterium]|nr:hypothetical protein [Deltaproteobacteria bacterium]
MGEYFYLVSSLPGLKPEGSIPISTKEFVETCARLMKKSDFELLQAAMLNTVEIEPHQNDLIGRWQAYEYGLRNELVRLRARKHSIDPESSLHQPFLNPQMAALAREIFDEESPLKAEQRYIKVLWAALDELQACQSFNLEYLMVYYLKLQLLERKTLFRLDAGKQKLESITRGELFS